ncbi:MAG: SurA N-terminal domain-containing protein [Pelagibacteraceae bacterium]
MISSFRNFAKTKIAGVFIFIIIIPFVFWGMGSMFNSGNTNNIAKINNTNISTQDFMNYLNNSGVSQQVIRDNLENNVIEELLSGLISTTLLDLEIKDFDVHLTQQTLLKQIKSNKNFLDENNVFQRTLYEKFLLTNNISAPMFELRLKNRELQKQLFDYIGAGSKTPGILVKKKFEDDNRILELEILNLSSFYKPKEEFDDEEIIKFIDNNKDQLKRDYIDFKYTVINPKNLIGIDEFNQEFFNKIDEIENKISQNINYDTLVSDLNLASISFNNFSPLEENQSVENKIYSLRSNKFDLVENGNEYILYSISKTEGKTPDINDNLVKNEILELIFQKNKFDFNKDLIEKIQNKEFNNDTFLEMSKDLSENKTINSIEDNSLFSQNSIKLLYSLPINSFTLVNDDNNNIFLTKILKSETKLLNNDESFNKYLEKQTTSNRNSILKSYDVFLNEKYKVELNQQTIDRVKNYFK